jgi:hypothetical protein
VGNILIFEMLQYNPLGEPTSMPWLKTLGCLGGMILFVILCLVVFKIFGLVFALPLLAAAPLVLYRIRKSRYESEREPIEFEGPPLPEKEPEDEPRAPLR